MDVDAYLRRIGYSGSLTPSVETLHSLHEAHLRTVPFENLDIHLGRTIRLNEGRLFDKIVTRRRGGFCYELNGLFGALLRELGFTVALVAADVYDPERGTFGPAGHHMAMWVEVDGAWLADVGFGGSFRVPVRLDGRGDIVTDVCGQAHRATLDSGVWTLHKRTAEGAWEVSCRFTHLPRALPDFEEACRYQQFSPASFFRQTRVCGRATPEGRIALRDQWLTLTARRESRVRFLSPDEYLATLRDEFGICLPEATAEPGGASARTGRARAVAIRTGA